MKDSFTDDEVADVVFAAVEALTRIQENKSLRKSPVELRETVSMLRSGHLPEEVHEHFCELAREQGWLHGPEFSRENKRDPRLTKYYDLPKGLQRRYDTLYGIIIALTI